MPLQIFFIKICRNLLLPVNLYRFYIYLRDHFLRTFVSCAIISVLKELIHLIHRLQRKERRMLFLDYQDRRPIYEQIVEKFRMLILSGAVEPSSKMPSPKRWMWPMRMPPSTASAGTAIPSGRKISSPTGRWPPSWPSIPIPSSGHIWNWSSRG